MTSILYLGASIFGINWVKGFYEYVMTSILYLGVSIFGIYWVKGFYGYVMTSILYGIFLGAFLYTSKVII